MENNLFNIDAANLPKTSGKKVSCRREIKKHERNTNKCVDDGHQFAP